MSDAIDIIATIRTRPEDAAEVTEMLAVYGRRCREMEGTDRFEVYVDRDDPTTIVVLERYRDQAAVDLHSADPANAELNEALERLAIGGGSELQWLVPRP